MLPWLVIFFFKSYFDLKMQKMLFKYGFLSPSNHYLLKKVSFYSFKHHFSIFQMLPYGLFPAVYLLTAASGWHFFFPSLVTFSRSSLFITASRSTWYLADCKSSTSVFWPQLLLVFLQNESIVAILDASSLLESKYVWALSVTSVVIFSISSISTVTF